MLPGLGFSEIVLLGVIALLVVGPKDLPLLLRRIGQFSARMRSLASEFRAGFDDLARTAELDQLKKEVDSLRNTQALRDLGRSVSQFGAAPNLLGPEGSVPFEATPGEGQSAMAALAPASADALIAVPDDGSATPPAEVVALTPAVTPHSPPVLAMPARDEPQRSVHGGV